MKRALASKALDVKVHNLREYTHDRHKTCDDRPFGGGPGMVMKPEPIFEALEDILGKKKKSKGRSVVYLTPQGKRLNQALTKKLAKNKELVLLCGHYEGIDERVVEAWVDEEVSIGDYVLTGGELPAMVLADAVSRHVAGVLGKAESLAFESFDQNLLEYPQYTRPAEYRGHKVPSVLLSGNHHEIESWRKKQALQRTKRRRPDLLKELKHESKNKSI